jgi:hypothetical protein
MGDLQYELAQLLVMQGASVDFDTVRDFLSASWALATANCALPSSWVSFAFG